MGDNFSILNTSQKRFSTLIINDEKFTLSWEMYDNNEIYMILNRQNEVNPKTLKL